MLQSKQPVASCAAWNFGVKPNAMGKRSCQRLLASAAAQNGIEFGKNAKASRHEIHTVLGQVDYDYQRLQYNDCTWRDEAAQRAGSLQPDRLARRRRRRWPRA